MAVELQGERSTRYNMPSLMFAELYYERNQIYQAEEALHDVTVQSELGFVDNLIAGFLIRGRLLMLHERYAEAETLLEEGDWLATRYHFVRMQAAGLRTRAPVDPPGPQQGC
ncbi:MAG: hypothetical protein EPN72_12365 [Nevskiaceae bacterium]|nr:MAG: hypothetical protein EPN63_00610 [Nevskiaceae bacterium]TBR71968.1 MAG: hypothetical protein EPN72_12365 [Nevskiaceae bacterium]